MLAIPGMAVAAEFRVESRVFGSKGEVIAAGQPVIEIRESYRGMTVKQRVDLVEARLRHWLEAGDFDPARLRVERSASGVRLSYRGELIVIADTRTAYQFRMTPEQLAERWRRNLTRVAPGFQRQVKVVQTCTGIASWYGREFRGRSTASGERFHEEHYTAAHRSLPFGTRIRVTNLNTGKAVIVTVNDRGPWIKGRLIDLSWASARSIGIRGVARVKMEVLAD